MKIIKKAETLIELTIAVSILAIILSGVMNILGNTKLLIEASKNRAVATTLAREGLEMVRYVRDYNWIAYAKQKRVCWNFSLDNDKDGRVNGSEICTENLTTGMPILTQILIGDYIPLQNFENAKPKFFLTKYLPTTSADDVLTTWNEKDAPVNGLYQDLKDFLLCQIGTGSTVVGSPDNLISSCMSPKITPDLLSSDVKVSTVKFFRKVKIEYVDIYGILLPDQVNIDKSANHMKVTSSVIWIDSSRVQQVELVTILSDWYQRGERES